MKKSYFIMLMALAFFLFGCREELDYVNSENSLQNSDSFTKDNVVTKKLFKQDYLSNSFLKQNVEAVNNFLKQKGSSSSAALSKNSTIEGVEVYTDVFEQVDYLNAKYYSFHIAGSSSKEFEQKLVLKYVNNEIKDRYILKYKRLPDLKIDPNSYQLEKLIGSSDGNGNSLLTYIDSFTLGCTTYTVTTFNCGHQGNHSNGEYCSVENTYIPHNIINAQYNPNCNSEGGGSPSGSTTGDSGSQGSQNTNGDNSPAFLSIYSSAPYYEIEFVPHTNKLLNYLNLNPTEITQINANDNLRLQIYLYLQNLGLYPFTPYLGDEYANASELTKFALQFFAQNPTTTWEQFQKWFVDGYSEKYHNRLSLLSNEELQEFININSEIDASPYDEENVKEANEIYVAITAQADLSNMNEADIETVLNQCCPNLIVIPQALISEKTKVIALNYKNLRRLYPNWSKGKCLWEASRDTVQLLLDIGGAFPLIGEVCDLTNGSIYAMNGDALNAALSYSAAIPLAGWGATASKYAVKTVHLVNGAKTTLKFIRRLDGVVTFGNRGQLRKVLGMLKGDLRQAHHIIPWELFDNPVVQKASLSSNAFHMNEALNGIPLSNVQHYGSHANYNARIEQYLNNWNAANPNATPDQAYNYAMYIIQKAKTAIQNNPTIKINDLIF